ncbi:MAG: flippase [Candidatus ainarchaeum sp.]|nr:flippase [Candidatus ainarchaeum sp.]MDD4662671.1 flippase [Candidatus ainarchaeum sp.]
MENTEKKTIVRNIGWLTISKVFVYLLSIVTITLIPRYLGVEGYGQLNFALSFVSLFAVFFDVGTGILIFRDVSRKKALLSKYFNNFFYFKIYLYILFFVVIVLITLLLPKLLIVKVLIVLLAINLIAQSIAGYLVVYLNSFELMKFSSIKEVLLKLLIVIFIILVVFLNLKIIGVALAYILSSVIVLFYIIYVFKKMFKSKIKFKPVFKKGFLLSKLKLSYPFALTTIFGVIYFNFDKFMISFMLNDYQVGLYSTGYTFYGFLIGIIALFSTVFFPILSRNYKSSRFKGILDKYSRIIIVLALPMVFGVIYLAKDIIRLIFGKDFVIGFIAFQVVIIFFLINAFNQIFNNILTIHNLQKYLFKLFLIAAVVNVVLNFIAIPLFGIVGAAVTTVLSELIIFVGMYVKVSKNIVKFGFFRKLVIPFISSILMLFGIYLVKDVLKVVVINNSLNVLFYFLVGGLFYVSFIFMFRYFKVKEIFSLLKEVRK